MKELYNALSDPSIYDNFPSISSTTSPMIVFSFHVQRLLSYPIRLCMHERGISQRELVKLLNESNSKLNYTYSSLRHCLYSDNIRNLNINYFGNIYIVLGLPFPTLEGLLYAKEQFDKVTESKRISRELNNTLNGSK